MIKLKLRITGRERKEVAGLIAGYFGTQSVYQGAPSFGYLITEPAGREWLIDKTGTISTQGLAEDNVAEMFAVLKALEENGAEAVGQVSVTVTTEGHNGVTLRNLVNLLAAKERLIAKAMSFAGQSFIAPAMVTAVNAVRLKAAEDFLETTGGEESPGFAITRETVTFRWFAATLDPEVIQAYIQFTLAVNKMALAQKHSSPHETDTTNEKYSFRVFLLRLGFIGEEYSASRKRFLDRLSGNGSFRTKEQEQEAARRRKEKIS